MTLDAIRTALLLDGVDSETVETFIRYHLSNKWIWIWFQKFTFQAIEARVRMGAKAIAERVRYEVTITRHQRMFKLNNNYPAYYARVFALKYPRHKSYFRNRRVRGLQQKEAA